MCEAPSFLPSALNLDGSWDDILSRLYDVFSNDFKSSRACHRGVRVIYDGKIKDDGLGKEEGFWHVVSKDDHSSDERLIDYPRAKRLTWAKPLMENSDESEVKVWQYDEGKKRKGLRTYIWLEAHNYALILQKKKRVYFWVTAFYVDTTWKRMDLKRRYEGRI